MDHKILAKYSDIEEIGRGNFGVVYKAKSIETGKFVAIKAVGVAKIRDSKNEIEVLKKLDNKHVLKLYDVLYSPTKTYIITELVFGGELFDRIVKKGKYSEEDARKLMWNLVEGLKYLHENNIVHRDLKPENILMVSTDNDYDIKIADYGVSCIIGEKRYLKGLVGTPHYLAPEIILLNRYSPKICLPSRDIWSLGVILYILLSGSPPFYEGKGRPDIYTQVMEGKYSFPRMLFRNVSMAAKDLIKKMLDVNPITRITLEGIMKDPWMNIGRTPVQEIKLPTMKAPLVLNTLPPAIFSPIISSPVRGFKKPNITTDNLSPRYVYIIDTINRKRYYKETNGKRVPVASKNIPVGVIPIKVNKR